MSVLLWYAEFQLLSYCLKAAVFRDGNSRYHCLQWRQFTANSCVSSYSSNDISSVFVIGHANKS